LLWGIDAPANAVINIFFNFHLQTFDINKFFMLGRKANVR